MRLVLKAATIAQGIFLFYSSIKYFLKNKTNEIKVMLKH